MKYKKSKRFGDLEGRTKSGQDIKRKANIFLGHHICSLEDLNNGFPEGVHGNV